MASNNGYSFLTDSQETAYQPTNGVLWYPRMITLANGEWICSFDTNEDGGPEAIKVIISDDQGQTWNTPILAVQHTTGDSANAQMAQLRNGDIWLSYRLVEIRDDIYYTSLKVVVSSDNGRTWQPLTNGEIASETSNEFKGVWEPCMGYMGDQFVCMYANDSLNVVEHGEQQMLYLTVWTGDGWSAPSIVSDGKVTDARDGMPVWDKMQDGRYIIVFETTDENDRFPFVIKYMISPDGFNWDVPRHTLYLPKKNGKLAAAPFVTVLADGRIVASFQTDEDKPGFGVEVCEQKMLIADANAENWDFLFTGFPTSNATHSTWCGMMPLPDGTFISAVSVNYPNPITFVGMRRSSIPTPVGVNLVNNWSFETGNISGWTTYGDDYPNRIIMHGKFENLDPPENGGDYFVGMASPQTGFGTAYIGQTISGLDSGTYTVRAMVRSSGGQTMCYFEVKDFGGETIKIDFPVTNEFQAITAQFEVTSGRATIGVYADMNSTDQWADFDMIEFYKAGETII